VRSLPLPLASFSGRHHSLRRVNPGLGFEAFATAQQTIQGYEAMDMVRQGQFEGITRRDVLAPNGLINRLFGLAASRVYLEARSPMPVVFATEPYSVAETGSDCEILQHRDLPQPLAGRGDPRVSGEMVTVMMMSWVASVRSGESTTPEVTSRVWPSSVLALWPHVSEPMSTP
jgi:hypothetical protein